MGSLKSTLTTIPVVTAVLLAGACSGDPPQAQSGPTPETTPTATAQNPATTSSSAPAWEAAYTSDELAAYDEAVSRFETYEQRSEPIWAAGKVTPAAEALFREFFPSPAWQLVLNKLATYERDDVRISGAPEVIWSEATRVVTDQTGGVVTIRQCVDYSGAQATQRGVAVDREDVFEGPVLRTIKLRRDGFDPWLIYQSEEPTAGDAQPCDPGGRS